MAVWHIPISRRKCSARPARGFTLLELVVTLCVAALLFLISMAAVSKARRSRTQAACVANLHAIGIAFSAYAMDYKDAFPTPRGSLQWEDQLRDYVHRPVFQCPADQEIFPALGSSYDWRDTGNPVTTLYGKTYMQVARNDVSLSFDALPGWHARNRIQVLYVNGAVEMPDQEFFFQELQRAPDQP